MLHILWMLLKIIGIIILVVLGFVLVALGVVFFVPLKYSGFGKLDKEIEKSSANIKFSWLCHLISGYVKFSERQLTYEVRIFCKIKNSVEQDTVEEILEESLKEEIEETTEESLEEKIEEVPENISDESNETRKSSPKQKRQSGKKKRNKKESLLKKIKYTFQNICDKIKMLKQKKDEVEAYIKDESHKAALKKVWKELKKLLRTLKPKKLTVNAHFGFEDPSLTGKVLAVLSMLYPFYGDNIRIQPDFENVIMEGDFYIKGKIRIIHAVKLAWNLIWDKNVRITIKDTLKRFN